MACVSDETQTEIDIHGYVLYSVASSSSCNIVVGSHSLMSKKVKAHKLPMVEQSEVEGSGLSANADCCRPGDYKILTRCLERQIKSTLGFHHLFIWKSLSFFLLVFSSVCRYGSCSALELCKKA